MTQDTPTGVQLRQRLDAQEARRRKKMGHVEPWSEREIEALTEIKGDDVAHAVMLWEEYAPAGWEGLLGARRVG
jgi:hypothetical protein